MRDVARTDGNQADIYAALRKVGAEVFDLSRVGGGCADTLVYYGGKLQLMEVKMPDGELNPKQRKFHARFPVTIVKSIEKAYMMIGLLGVMEK